MNATSASPVPESIRFAPSRATADISAAVTGATLAELRRSFILLEHDRTQGALLTVLRLESAELPTTRANLRHLGFHPDASPARSSISWRRYVSSDDIGATCNALGATFGGEILFDLGARFTEPGVPPIAATELAPYWTGRFVLHVGGSRRAIVFDRTASSEAITHAFDAQRAAYMNRDFVSPSE